MRGTDETSGSLFSYVDLEERIPVRHPLRKIRQVVNDALASLDAEFEALYEVHSDLRDTGALKFPCRVRQVRLFSSAIGMHCITRLAEQGFLMLTSASVSLSVPQSSRPNKREQINTFTSGTAVRNAQSSSTSAERAACSSQSSRSTKRVSHRLGWSAMADIAVARLFVRSAQRPILTAWSATSARSPD